ncbi:hypothetical protein M8818_001916 [Zalaria obscura]|uniref:Uncharacterized protein n=1 Tax=Zalaria obscura TaxID=2024903 RepID=A0ACC3SJ36_9PEZI
MLLFCPVSAHVQAEGTVSLATLVLQTDVLLDFGQVEAAVSASSEEACPDRQGHQYSMPLPSQIGCENRSAWNLQISRSPWTLPKFQR